MRGQRKLAGIQGTLETTVLGLGSLMESNTFQEMEKPGLYRVRNCYKCLPINPVAVPFGHRVVSAYVYKVTIR